MEKENKEQKEKNEKTEKELGTIRMTKTDDGIRLDISGDMMKNCRCGCEPNSKEKQTDSSCC